MIAVDMENALTEFVHVIMDLVRLIVVQDVLDMDKDAVETEIAFQEIAIVTQDGQDTLVKSEPACMIVLNMVIAAMVHVFAKKDTEEEIAHFHRNHNLANVLFIVFVVVFNSVQHFMKNKELDHHMSATQNAHKNVFLNVLLEKCQKTSVQMLLTHSKK